MLILLGALALRVAFVVAQPGFRPFADAASFDQTAVAVASQGSYPPTTIAPSGGPTALRPPGYPYLLAALYAATGTEHSSARFRLGRLLGAVISTGIVGLVGLIAFLLWASWPPTWAAMVLAAVYPPLVTLGVSMLSEPLFTLLLLGAVAAVLMARRSDRPTRWAILAGALAGLAILTRTNGIIVLVPLAAGLLWPRRGPAAAAALVVSALLVLVPWAVRDAVAFHRFVPLSTQTGFTAAGTYNSVSYAHEARWIVPTMPPYNRLRAPHETEAQIELKFRSAVLRFIRRHPGYVLRVGYYNLGRLLELEGPGFERGAAAENGLSFTVSDIDVYSFYALAALSLLALLRGGLRRAPAFVWGVPLALVLSLIFVLAYMRYRFPIDPFLILLVAGGLVAVGSRLPFRAPPPATRAYAASHRRNGSTGAR